MTARADDSRLAATLSPAKLQGGRRALVFGLYRGAGGANVARRAHA
jgi:hypothetical protein